MAKEKMKIRITKCYLVEVVDENGMVYEFENRYGQLEVADDYCFGTKEDAKKLGEDLKRLVIKNRESEGENE